MVKRLVDHGLLAMRGDSCVIDAVLLLSISVDNSAVVNLEEDINCAKD